MKVKTVDINFHKVTRNIHRVVTTFSASGKRTEIWAANVWFGNGVVTSIRTYYYRTRRNARNADISDDIGKNGRVE